MALFLNHPECSAQCAVGMYEALYTNFNIEFFGVNDFNSKIFQQADIIAFPGGIGDSETFHKYIGDNKYYVQEAISKGVRYLGICMGAYWAGSHYFDIVEGFDSAVDLPVEFEAKLQEYCCPTSRPHEWVWPRTLCDLVFAGHGYLQLFFLARRGLVCAPHAQKTFDVGTDCMDFFNGEICLACGLEYHAGCT